VLIVYTVPPDGPDAERLQRLASLIGEPDPVSIGQNRVTLDG